MDARVSSMHRGVPAREATLDTSCHAGHPYPVLKKVKKMFHLFPHVFAVDFLLLVDVDARLLSMHRGVPARDVTLDTS